jgi:excinuclease ABC subunit C
MRPCLLFQIKRCSGPCTGEIAIPDYQALAGQARDFLSGRSSNVKQLLSTRMQEAAEELEFEKAAQARDQLTRLKERVFGSGGNDNVVPFSGGKAA